MSEEKSNGVTGTTQEEASQTQLAALEALLAPTKGETKHILSMHIMHNGQIRYLISGIDGLSVGRMESAFNGLRKALKSARGHMRRTGEDIYEHLR